MQLKTFDGFNINNANYRARPVGLHNLARAANGYVQVSNAYPQDAGVYQIEPRTISLDVRIQNYAERDALAQALLRTFYPGKVGELVAGFGGIDYQMRCRVEQPVQSDSDPLRFTITLNCGESDWMAATAENTVITVNANPYDTQITVGGTLETALSILVTPAAVGAGGNRYQRLYQLVNAVGVDWGRRPWCVTLSTSALVSGGKMRSDGEDIRVFFGDQEMRRYIASPNGSATKVWFTPTHAPGYALTLGTAIASSGAIGEMTIKKSADALKTLRAMPKKGYLVHGTEWIAYDGITTAEVYRVAVTERGALGTALQAHAAGSAFNFIQAPVYLTHGDLTATAPASLDADYDNDKPMFDLTQSDNEHWVYTDATGFRDPARLARPGQWTPGVKRSGDVSRVYDVSQDAESGAPAMGMLMGCYQKDAKWRSESATLAFGLFAPGGFQKVSATASKRRNSARWPGKAGLQYSENAEKWKDAWDEASPVNINTWTPITQNDKSTGNAKYVQFALAGSMAMLAGALAYLEILTCSVYFRTSTLPVGTLLGEVTNYPLALTVTHLGSGEAFSVRYPMQIGDTLALDGELYEATCAGANVHGAVALDDNSRDTWLRLFPGANNLRFSFDGNVGTLGVTLLRYARRA